ncbi:unnamed protein product [Chondrus crispus]|uniref:Reverse transcriptase domain-containing protein n=1 Tax=Chondrus crispus TaxID=2769 RepID=R7Q6Z1_CHOCR|nr:unnamed protein product [Chondrus crispus]CDF33588.1 unnamed protein product [Chondrus crispus]|eukprot:XP_005713391.1 unnamed protein product [Chondrus crispus]
MDECLDSLDDANVFTTLDCPSVYWKIPVAEEDRPKTTCTCHAGTYHFNRMPFGLMNAPATFGYWTLSSPANDGKAASSTWITLSYLEGL